MHPLLPSHVKMAVVGAIADHVDNRPGLTRVRHVDDLAPYYKDSQVVICPLLGGTGLKVKVVEALSFGRPVVTTTAGMAGMRQKQGNGCIVADAPDAFADAIMKLLADDAHRVGIHPVD